jgi:hypothetical protein
MNNFAFVSAFLFLNFIGISKSIKSDVIQEAALLEALRILHCPAAISVPPGYIEVVCGSRSVFTKS